MRLLVLVAGLAMAAPPLIAQQSTPPARTPAERVASAADSALRRALELPEASQRARDAGVPDSSVRGVLERLRRERVPAGDAAPAVIEEAVAVESGSPRDNFGAFVRSQVESGVRGRELAERIRAERAARGFGRADAGARPAPGRPAGAGPPAGAGRPEGAGPPAEAGRRPAGAGPPAGADRRPAGADRRPEGAGPPAAAGARPGTAGPPTAGARPGTAADTARGKAAQPPVRRP